MTGIHIALAAILTVLAATTASVNTANAGTASLTGDLPRRDGAPLVETAGLDTEYGAVLLSDGYRLRSMVTRPEGTNSRLPAIFVTQWVSCDGAEFEPPERYDRLRDLAQRSGWVLIRVDRAGAGDSEGPACSELDYNTEVRHYREALDALTRHAWVDPDRIVIYGISLGSTTAPLVASGKKIAGVMVQGAGAVTYLERMINFDRIDLELSDKFPVERQHDEMLKRIRFQQAYLLGRKTPSQVVADEPDLAGVWESLRGTDEPPHYGRPFAWHWQAAEKNFVAAWAAIDAPVLVIHGEYEQFEPEHGHRLIVETVNAQRPGTATFVQISHAGHGLRIYGSKADAYRFENGVSAPELFMQPVLGWLRGIEG